MKRHDHSSLIERMSRRQIEELLAPQPERSHHPVTSIVQLTRCSRCKNFLTERGRASRNCDECGAHLAE